VDLAFWRDVSVVWLSFLCFIGLLIPLAAVLFAVKGMHVAVDRTPRYLRQAQRYSRLMRDSTDRGSRQVTEQVIRSQTAATRFQTRFHRIVRTIRSSSVNGGKSI
jgi:hypothetical protein